MLTQGYIDFFTELSENNHKEWFHANKKRYDVHAKGGFSKVVQGVLDRLQDDSPDYPEKASSTLFRINRDMRFVKEGGPYHTIMKASLVRGGKKSAAPRRITSISTGSIAFTDQTTTAPTRRRPT